MVSFMMNDHSLKMTTMFSRNCFLWIGVKQEDRCKPPRVQWDENLPRFTCIHDKEVVGTGIYHVGDQTSIETPHPITVAHICQNRGTTYQCPVVSDHGGFVISIKGSAIFGGIASKDDYAILVFGEDRDDAGYLEIQTQTNVDAEYLVCFSEKIGEQWAKKLVASGAIITATKEEARELAPKVEKMSKNGKAEGGSFASFGL